MEVSYCVSSSDILAAAARIHGIVHRTPVLTSSSLDAELSSTKAGPVQLLFKCENFQKTGSFKARGACNAVLSLPASAIAVCTHSSGNHAGALAWAARVRGIAAHIVMPAGAPASKVAAVKAYGARVLECEPTQQAREAAAREVQVETGAAFVHPSEDPSVIAGQGTMALELLEQARGVGNWDPATQPVVDVVVVPVGGGGMISGVATAVKAADPRILVLGAEPKAADDAARSKAAGSVQKNASPPQTIADGLKTTLGPNTWPIVRGKVDGIVTVSEAEIRAALRVMYARLKVVLEPSAGTGLAAVMSEDFAAAAASVSKCGRPLRVAVVLCGGNLDLEDLPAYIAL